MIERQTDIHPVLRCGRHGAGKAVARKHQPVVIDIGGLGQPGGARRIDEESAILDGERPPFRGVEPRARQGLDVAVDAREIGPGVAVRPCLGIDGKMHAGGGEACGELGAHDDVLGGNDVDAMSERGAAEIGVEQRHGAADAGDAEPDRHVFGPVGHQQADRLALVQSLRQGPTGIAVGSLCQRAIGEPFPLGQERRRVAEPLGEIIDNIGEEPGRVLGDGGRQAQCAQRAFEIGEVIADAFEKSHGPLSARGARRRNARAAPSARALVNIGRCACFKVAQPPDKGAG